MSTIYKYYNPSDSSYIFSILNKSQSPKKTTIQIGDTTNEIYSESSNNLTITSNLKLDKNLDVLGDLQVGEGTAYHLIAKEGKVAINKNDINLDYTLDVGGGAKVDGDFYVEGESTHNNILNVNGNINVNVDKLNIDANTGSLSINTNKLVVDGDTGDLTINTDKFIVNGDTGNTTIEGDLTVNGKLLGRLPLGSIVPFFSGYFTAQNNVTFSNFSSSAIPQTGIITKDGFLLCDGAVIPSDADPLFYSESQVRYMPKLNDDIFLQGTTNSFCGQTGGQNSITLSIANLPSHDHGGTLTTSNPSISMNHSHTYKEYEDTGTELTPSGDDVGQLVTKNTSSVNLTHTHTVTITAQGSGTPFENRPKYISVMYIMRVK